MHLHLGNPGPTLFEANTVGDPVPQDLVVGFPWLGEHTTHMGDTAGHFQKHQAGIRSAAVEPAPLEIVGQGPVVKEWVITAQGQFEPVLSIGCAVASSLVATHPGKDRPHLLDEPDRRLGRHPLG